MLLRGKSILLVEKNSNFSIEPKFFSNASEFHVTLWNLNFNFNSNDIMNDDVETIEYSKNQPKEFTGENKEFTKEFTKATRQIYRLVSMNPQISIAKMSENMNLSTRQVSKYMKRLQELNKITRIGGRKTGEWKIIDEEYEGFFDRI